MNTRTLLMVFSSMCFMACDVEQTAKSRGPITLGDSSTFITETDPAALQDQVPDLKPFNSESGAGNPASAADTVAKSSKPAESRPAADGLTIAFKEITLAIPGIATRSYSKTDLQKASSVAYQLTSGDLAKTSIQASGGTVSKVNQQYETIVVLKHGNDYLPLESLGKYTSAWQSLSGSGNKYPISGLEPAKLGFKNVSQTTIRNAVQAAARKARLNRKDTRDLQQDTRNIRAANQAPASVALSSVTWQIQGKDAAGKTFNKELRIEVPLP